ncbi:MAG: hypothetical protein C5B48_06065 [Candidatus Rokuibacteriota bacterium]|nr:MAG: hypothetical protein C5B48_06065 [Candidatus Rokubacteria bacterium]
MAVGSASALLVIRAQLFSLALFPALVLLLRRQGRTPSDGIWLLVPLLALWANLYGGVLVGFAVAAVYLIALRLRQDPPVALAVLCLSAAACLATPALLGSLRYYRGVLFGEAASSGEGLWAPLSLSKPFDLVFCVAAVVVVGLAIAARPKLWELIVVLCLAAATLHVGRNGVWLLLFAAAPAARALSGSRVWRFRVPRGLAAVLGLCLLLLLVVGLSRTPPPAAAGAPLRLAAARAAGPAPVLADDINAEALALDGRTVLIANPLDAFRPQEQRLYLDWIAGRPTGDALLLHARAVLVTRGTPPERHLAHDGSFRLVGSDSRAALFVRYRPARWQSPPSSASSSRAS